MTTLDILIYYANLLIIQYIGKPKAYATIQAQVKPVIMDQLPVAVMNAYNLIGTNTAVGKQLDVLGKYVGVKRTGIGTNGPISLDDADFLTLIQFAILINTAESSLSAIQALLNQYFPNEILVFDYRNMQMSYLVSSSLGNQDLIQLAIAEDLLPRPMAVSLSIVTAPVINTFFGFRTYAYVVPNNSPLNSYASYQTDRPWLSYKDAVTI